MESKKVLLSITDLKQYFPLKKSSFLQKEQLFVKANDGISLNIYEGETLGLVGESGCGKSTFGRVLLQLYHQTDGKTLYYGRSRSEFAPEYEALTLRNLPNLRRELEALRKKQKELSEKASKEEREKLDGEVKKAFLEITQLIGGFYAAADLEKVSEVFLKKHRIAAALREASSESDSLAVRRFNGKTGMEDRARALREKCAKLQGELDGCLTQIEAMRISHINEEGYGECEAFRDDGIDLARLNYKEMRLLRKDLQLIFQDPYSSLNPRMTVGQIIGEGLMAHGMFTRSGPKMQEYIRTIMEECGLASYMIHRYPHQFSGGQRQRIGIARSLALRPKFVVCDEAVSALDVSIQSQIINLLQELKEREKLTYLFISHDLSVVKYISDRIGVMYLGSLVELSESEEIFRAPHHPYTEALLSSIPTTEERNREAILLEGDIPSPIKPPKGCKFHTRCRYATDVCKEVTPAFIEVTPGHFSACHHPLNNPADSQL